MVDCGDGGALLVKCLASSSPKFRCPQILTMQLTRLTGNR